MTLTTLTPTDTPSLFSIVEERGRDGQRQRGVDLRFHEGQARAWRSARRIVAIISGSQGGKTSFGPWWLAREIEQGGPGDYIAATATYDLFKLKMLPEMRVVFEDTLGVARFWSGDQILELCEHTWHAPSGMWVPQRGAFRATRSSDPMWARIILRSASSPGGLESATAKAAWLDEAGQDEFPLTAWEAVRRRLALSRGRILITTTPYNLGWLKHQVYDRWLRGDKTIDVIQFASILNPAFSREEFEERRQEMDDWKFRMFYEGQFERPAGLIYSAFIDKYKHEGGHKVAPFRIPLEWPRWGGIDPGAVHHAKVWLAYDPTTSVYYLYRESLAGEMSTSEHAEDIRSYPDHERVVLWFAGQKSEKQQRLDYEAAGLLNENGWMFQGGLYTELVWQPMERLLVVPGVRADDAQALRDRIHQCESVLRPLWKERDVDAVLAVWKDWSEKIVDMHSENENQYGPFRYGPAYPFNAMEPDLEASELPLPPMYLTLNYRRSAAKNESLTLQIELLDPMVESFMSGGDKFLAMAAAETELQQKRALGAQIAAVAPAPEPEPVQEAFFDIGPKAEAGHTYSIAFQGSARPD